MRSEEGTDDAGLRGASSRVGLARPGTADRRRPGTTASFEAFYRSERAAILAVAGALVGDWDIAEDVVQESFAEAYRRWRTVEGFDRPGAWVRRVAINKAISRVRRRSVETRALGRIGVGVQFSSDAPVADAALWEVVRRLPRRQAQVIALTYIGDLTMAEVAEVLGCTEGSVKTHLRRARERLAQDMPANGWTDGSADA